VGWLLEGGTGNGGPAVGGLLEAGVLEGGVLEDGVLEGGTGDGGPAVSGLLEGGVLEGGVLGGGTSDGGAESGGDAESGGGTSTNGGKATAAGGTARGGASAGGSAGGSPGTAVPLQFGVRREHVSIGGQQLQASHVVFLGTWVSYRGQQPVKHIGITRLSVRACLYSWATKRHCLEARPHLHQEKMQGHTQETLCAKAFLCDMQRDRTAGIYDHQT
jgi:hypothetical protein